MSWPKLGDEVTVFVSHASYPARRDHFAFARVTGLAAGHFIATISVVDPLVSVDMRGMGIVHYPDSEGVRWCFGHSERTRRALEVAHALSA